MPHQTAPRNIVICCDGTGNEIGSTLSNVLKLYRTLEKSERQHSYYHPGVGTIARANAWQRWRQRAHAAMGLATGLGLDGDVLHAYRFLCAQYRDGDRIWLFGFSRGAYTARVLAALVHVIGLLSPDQLDLAGYAFTAYKKASRDHPRDAQDTPIAEEALAAARDFAEIASTRSVSIAFLGLWDTVASIIVPRDDSWWPDMQILRFTRANPGVRVFRQACAIDERRRLFRLQPWRSGQIFRPPPGRRGRAALQDARQVWFAGAHADIGGGYPERESGLSKFPLSWMIGEARHHGLLVNEAMFEHLVNGAPLPGSRHAYAAPSSSAPLHPSLSGAWQGLEWWPKRVRWREWPQRRAWLGLYLPRGEPRLIPSGALLHWSVLERQWAVPDYHPANLPAHFEVEHAADSTDLYDEPISDITPMPRIHPSPLPEIDGT